MIIWIVINVTAARLRWDPYPLILLNLLFSTQASYAAPLILLAQNRQAERDRAAAERDRRGRAATRSPLDLSPPPGALWTVDQRVEVTFDVPATQSVRLLIDGTDVTADAVLGDSQLTYDAQQAPRPVPLGSGEHTARIERVRTGEDRGQDAVPDIFTWSFEIPRAHTPARRRLWAPDRCGLAERHGAPA